MRDNPYVGPRPFERSDWQKFYGREREARELQALITAEREVLLYAQSGAGKTSLLNARVIPALEKQGFQVLPVARVGMELPPEVRPDEVQNVFVFSALLSLVGEDADPRPLLGLDLPGYLRALLQLNPVGAQVEQAEESEDEDEAPGPPAARPPVLVFDQFEELFTAHRGRWQEARGFFQQVRQALDQIPGLGVVFSMREDHAAALDPYLAFFASRLRVRFRLELLGERGALQAITRPASEAGLRFAEGVAERLVDDLRRINVTAAGPSETTGDAPVLGQVIEPVQLQVVCSQLWASLPDDKQGEIVWEEVEKYGSVEQALIAFYEDSVRRAALETGTHERDIRRWFGSQMITPVHTRGLALRTADATAGLPNAAVAILEDRHIIRAEIRAGARWYELAHDRLIDPILNSNRAFERATATPLRAAARKWKDTGDALMLFRGDALREAEQQLQDFDERPVYLLEPEPFEREFVAASRQAEKASRQARLVWILVAMVGLLLLVILTGLTIFAFDKSEAAQSAASTAAVESTRAIASESTAVAAQQVALQSEQLAQEKEQVAVAALDEVRSQAVRARARELASLGTAALEQNQYQLALLLALQGIAVDQESGEARLFAGEQVLRDALSRMSGKGFRCAGQDFTAPPLSAPELFYAPLSASPDGRWLVGQAAGQLCLWDLSVGPPGLSQAEPRIIEGSYQVPFFAHGGRWLFAYEGSEQTNDYSVLLAWDMTDLNRPPIRLEPPGIQDLQLLDGGWLVYWSADGMFLANLDWPDMLQAAIPLQGLSEYGIAISPDQRFLLAQDDLGLRLLDLTQIKPGKTKKLAALPVIISVVDDAAFSPDGAVLATLRLGSEADWGTALVELWDLRAISRPRAAALTAAPAAWQPRQVMRFIIEPSARRELFYSPDGRWLAATQNLQDMVLWNFAAGPFSPSNPSVVQGDYSDVLPLAFSADSCWLTSIQGNEYRTYPARIWPLYAGGQVGPPLPLEQKVPGGLFDLTLSWPEPAADTAVRSGEEPASAGFVRYAAALDPGGALHVIDLWSDRAPEPGCGQAPARTAQGDTELPFFTDFILGGQEPGAAARVFVPGSPWLISTNTPGAARIWDIREMGAAVSPQSTFFSGQDWSRGYVKTAPNGGLLLPLNDTVRLLPGPIPDESAAAAFEAGGPISATAVSPDGRWLAAAAWKNQLRLWSVDKPNDPTSEVFIQGEADAVTEISAVAFSPEGAWLGVRGNTGLTVFPVDADGRLGSPQALDSRSIAFVFRPDGQGIMVLSRVSPDADMYHLVFWRLAGDVFQQVRQVALPDAASYHFGPMGDYLALHSKTDRGMVELWDLRDFAAQTGGPNPPVWLLEHSGMELDDYQLYFSPSGRWLLTGELSGSLFFLWDLQALPEVSGPMELSGSYVHQLALAAARSSLAFSPDEAWLALASQDEVRLWNLADLPGGSVTLRAGVPNWWVESLIFTGFDREHPATHLVVSNNTGFGIDFYYWPLERDPLIGLACEQLFRGFTPLEVQQYLQGEAALKICP